MRIIVTTGSIEKAKEFVNLCNRHDIDVDVTSARYTVDGKSILGVMSLDLGKPFTVDICGGDTDQYNLYLSDLRKNGFIEQVHRPSAWVKSAV